MVVYIKKQELIDVKLAVDMGWIMTSGVVIFLMNAGFAMLESGSVRFKNVQVVLVKNMIHALLGGIIWWAFGFAFAFGDLNGGFIGSTYFFGLNIEKQNQLALWFLSYTFACTSTTIVSGSLAERININCYIVFSVIMFGFTYPLIVAWTWGGGFLSKLGFQDFAGSGIVHMTGAFSGLMGTIIMGPRIGKFKDIRSGIPIATDTNEFDN